MSLTYRSVTSLSNFKLISRHVCVLCTHKFIEGVPTNKKFWVRALINPTAGYAYTYITILVREELIVPLRYCNNFLGQTNLEPGVFV